MGEIVLHGQKFKIKGDAPTPQEQVAIDSYLDFRETNAEATGNEAFDEQGILSLSPEQVLSESRKGKYNKETESFLNSPSFKRIVAEVGLSIAGGIAGVALAPVTGGASLVTSAGLAARVARIARPLINISENTVRRIGAGTAGAAIGGGTGAGLAQAFDPKEDIVAEVTRGTLQGGLGELAGFGLAGGLSKVYNKIIRGKVTEVNGARQSLDILDREKKFFGELAKIKSGGQLTAKEIEDLSEILNKEQIKILKDPDASKELIAKLESKNNDFFIKDIKRAQITPAQATDSMAIDLFQGMARSSFMGGQIIRAEGSAINTLASGMETYANAIIKASAKDSIDPQGTLVGAIIQSSLRKSQKIYNANKTALWQDLKQKSQSYLIDPITKKPYTQFLVDLDIPIPKAFDNQVGKVVSTNSIKDFAIDEVVKLQKAGPAYRKKHNDVEKYLGDIIREDTKVSYPRLTDMYTEMQAVLEPKTQLATRVNAELTKRMVGLIDNAKLPDQLSGLRNTVVAFSKMGDQTFKDVLMKKIMSTEKGAEKVYNTIVVANDRTTTNRFLDLIDKKIPVKPGGPAVPLFENPEVIKNSIRGQFFKNFLKAAEDPQYQYQLLNSGKAADFLQKYKGFIDDVGLITKEQSKNLNEYVNALKFAQGKISKPGELSDKAGSVFIQLKQAGAVTQLIPVVLGGTGQIDLGSAGAFFLAPLAISTAFTRPGVTRVLIEGAKLNARNFGTYERYMTQLTSTLVGQGFVGADQGKMVMDQVRASKPTLEQVFKGEIPNNATLTIDNPADAPFLDLTQQEAEQQLAATQQSQKSTGQLPNVTPSNVGSISPQARMALAGGNLDQAIAAQSMQQMPQLKRGGIVSAKK